MRDDERFRCVCVGGEGVELRCDQQASQEDGLCDDCRDDEQCFATIEMRESVSSVSASPEGRP